MSLQDTDTACYTSSSSSSLPRWITSWSGFVSRLYHTSKHPCHTRAERRLLYYISNAHCGLTSQVSQGIWARRPPLTSCSIESFPPPTEHKMDTSSSALHQPRKMFFNLFLQHFTARSDWKASLSTRSIEPGSATPPSTSSPSISTTTF